MRMLLTTFTGVYLVLCLYAQTVRAEGWSLWPSSSTKKSAKGPSTWEQISSTPKKAFAATKDALTFNKPAPKKSTGGMQPWNPSRRKKVEEKKSWFDGLFVKKEPDPPKTLKEWMDLPRADP